MGIPRLAALLLLIVTATALRAQDSTAFYQVAATTGAEFFVDGQRYVTATGFAWIPGSKHVLEIRRLLQNVGAEKRMTFAGWSIPGGGTIDGVSPIISITASRDMSSYFAGFVVEYLVDYRLNAPPGANTGVCGPSSVAGGMCVPGNAQTYIAEGVTIVLLPPSPGPGWLFQGWIVNNLPIQFTASFTVSGPMWVEAYWLAARHIQITTNPPGLALIVNRNPSPDAAGFDVALGGKLLLAAPENQVDSSGAHWAIDSFVADGVVLGGLNSVYTVSELKPLPVSITANFVRAVQSTILTDPTRLKVTINGRNDWLYPIFWWGIGSQNSVSAPAQQTDAQGRRYAFKKWSNGGSASLVVSPTLDDLRNDGLRLVASYELLGRITLTSTAPETFFQVDGVPCKAPCVVDRAAGTDVRISAPVRIPADLGTHIDFGGWSDGGTADRIVTVTTSSLSLAARYQTLYGLRLASDPARGVDFTVSPASADGYYADGTTVSVEAAARPGFRFRRWGGDLSGTYPTGTVSLNRASSVVALLDRVAYVSPAGVQNAAGETPEAIVAPGSIISIYGESLAEAAEIGPSDPLAQTVGGLVVQFQDRLLPLYFVSPEQVNAFLPSDIPEGEYSLSVVTSRGETVSADFKVARNAPGLFTRIIEERTVALATRADGLPVAPGTPARRGEVVTLLGTGFGPYDQTPIDGFPIPKDTEYKLVDVVEILAGDSVYIPEWTGAAVGYSGLVELRFRIPDTWTSRAAVDIAVRMGERMSNTVTLIVE